MVDEAIAPEVVKFVNTFVSSVSQLEVLLLLRGDAGRAWAPEEIAGEMMYLDPSAAAAHLDSLAGSGLLSASGSSYRYAPRTRKLAASVEQVAQLYARRRHRLIRLIYEAPEDAARSLSDAFRFRKDD
jgi:DNA-binding IclR family transcriptional regulator